MDVSVLRKGAELRAPLFTIFFPNLSKTNMI